MTGESQVEEPRTGAGRNLLVEVGAAAHRGGGITVRETHAAIRAIEREARAAALAAVEEAVAGLDRDTATVSGAPRGPVLRGKHESFRAVLAAITALRQPQEAKDTRGEDR